MARTSAERSAAAGSEDTPPALAALATVMPTSEERSEAAGSDVQAPPPQGPRIIQGLPPPPPMVQPVLSPTPTASEERSEAAGSDRREVPSIPNPGPVQVQPPPGRNVTGSDVNSDLMSSRSNQNRNRISRLEAETDEADESTTNDDSRKPVNPPRKSRHQRASPPLDAARSKKHQNRNTRSPSGSGGSRSSSPSVDEREAFNAKKREYRRTDRDREWERDREKRDKVNSSRRDDRANRSQRYFINFSWLS